MQELCEIKNSLKKSSKTIKIQVVNLYVRFARLQECEKYVAIIVKLMPYFGKFYMSSVSEMGSPIKGIVKRKNTSPLQINTFFFA